MDIKNFFSSLKGVEMRRILLLAIVACLLGCAVMPVPQSRMPFPEKEYQALSKSGNATVKGQAFLKTGTGDINTATGKELILDPVTSYSLEWFEKSYLTGKPMMQPDPRLSQFILKQVTDENGRFIFENVSPGEYFAVMVIHCEENAGDNCALPQRCGAVAKRITVKNDDELYIILTQ
jgi:hypothetical protein